jgi:hypothetical protein
MFAPNQERAAAEMLRVCRPGGKIGLTCWTPASYVGEMFKRIVKYVPPPAGVKPALHWGTEARLRELFGESVTIAAVTKNFIFHAPSTEAWLEHFKTYYGPMNRTFAALDEAGQAGLRADVLAVANSMNRADDGTMVLPGEYLEIVLTKAV